MISKVEKMSELTILVIFSISCLCLITAEPALSLKFESFGSSAFHVNFGTAVLEQFHGCLCDTTKYFCAVSLIEDVTLVADYTAIWKEGRTNLIDVPIYSNTYSCYLYRLRRYPHTPRSISCTRMAKNVASYIVPPDEPCEVLSLISNSQGTCDLRCVNLQWIGSFTGTIIRTNTDKANCGLCGSTTSTTTSTVTTSKTTALNISSLLSIKTTENSGDNDDEETDNEIVIIVGLTATGIVLVLMISVAIVFLLRRKQSKLKSQPSNMSLLYANQSVSLEVHTPSGQTTAEVGAVSAARRHGNIKVSDTTRLSVNTPDCSQVTPHRPEEISNSFSDSPGDQALYGHDVTQEPHSMEIMTQISSTPDVYAKLHERARNFHNPYDMLMDSKANLKSRSSLPIRTQSNARDLSGPSSKSVEIVSYPMSTINHQGIRDVQGILDSGVMSKNRKQDTSEDLQYITVGSATDVSTYQDIDDSSRLVDAFPTQSNIGHHSLNYTTLSLPTYQNVDGGIDTVDIASTQCDDVHYSVVESSINIPTYQDVDDDAEPVGEFRNQSEGVQYATIGSTLNLSTYQNTKTIDERVNQEEKEENGAQSHDMSFNCNVYEDVAESNSDDSTKEDKAGASYSCQESELYKNISQVESIGQASCTADLAKGARVADTGNDISRLSDEIPYNTDRATEEPGYANVGNQNLSENHVYANFPDDEENLQNVYFVLEKQTEYEE